VNDIPKPQDVATGVDWVARARDLAPLIAAASPRIERERQVTDEVMAALHDAQLFRMTLPRSLGGGEATAMEVVEVMETVAAADASTAWCLGQAQGCCYAGSYLAHDSALEIFGPPGRTA
jgi:alkylation response protein AidB-like acyl-CoA dehydrogenase